MKLRNDSKIKPSNKKITIWKRLFSRKKIILLIPYPYKIAVKKAGSRIQIWRIDGDTDKIKIIEV